MRHFSGPLFRRLSRSLEWLTVSKALAKSNKRIDGTVWRSQTEWTCYVRVQVQFLWIFACGFSFDMWEVAYSSLIKL